MRETKSFRWIAALAIIVFFAITGFSQDAPIVGTVPPPTLGQAAPAPAGLTLNPPSIGGGIAPAFQQPVTGGLSINTSSRESVREFYNAIYPASENIPQDSTADASACFPGHNSDAFQNAELLRINWYRAMAGMPASIYLDPLDVWGSQQMAIIISANNALNHNPPSSYDCYSTEAAAYAGGDQALGADGADATTLFIWDFGANNNEVGHRRWILYPEEIVMGVGDVPGAGPNAASNLTYVFDPLSFGSRPTTRQPFVAWPPQGYVPYQVVFPYWSFALTNADFTNATVTMTSNGVPVAVAIQPYQVGFGENTLVWLPMGLVSTNENNVFPFNGTDTVYNVAISNIVYGSSVVSYSYSVTVFDPAVPGGDYVPSELNGPAQAAANTGTIYYATPPALPNVTSYNFFTGQLTPGNLYDDASAGVTNFALSPLPNYAPIMTAPNGMGTSFNLEHADTNSSPQLFQLNEVLFPASNTVVSFESELGYAFTDEVARVQVSSDGGFNWVDLYARPGNVSGNPDDTYSNISLSLSNYAGDSVLLRFNFDFQGGDFYNGGYPLGWFFTDVLITNTQAIINQTTNNSTITNIVSGNLADWGLNGLTNFTVSPPPYYYVITNPPVGPEPTCFHLAHQDSTPQYLQLNETLLPNANSTISFSSQMATATSDEYALVEVSTNNGTNWTDIYSEAGGTYENSFTPYTLSLAQFAGQLSLLRFNYSFTGGSYYPQSQNYIGWNIEDIAISNCQQQLITTVDTTNFTFTPTQAGTYILQDQPVIYNQFPLPIGPVTKVNVVGSSTITLSQPVQTNRLLQLNFTVTGFQTNSFHLLQAAQLNGHWTTNASAPFTTNIPGSSYRFTVTNNTSAQFYRVQSP